VKKKTKGGFKSVQNVVFAVGYLKLTRSWKKAAVLSMINGEELAVNRFLLNGLVCLVYVLSDKHCSRSVNHLKTKNSEAGYKTYLSRTYQFSDLF